MTVARSAKVQKNSAKDGGGIWSNTATIGGEISENNAVDTYGGGVYAKGTVNVNDASSLITKNNGKLYGGGVYSLDTVDISNGTISLNKAPSGGAGVIAPTIKMSGGTVTGNETQSDGGGLHVRTGGLLELTGGTISANKAGLGGGIWTASSVTATGGSIANNESVTNGAGIYGSTQDLTIDVKGNTSITGNIAKGNGGGIYATNCKVKIDGTARVNNNTAVNGGGIFGYGAPRDGFQVEFNGGEIKGNTASNNGGGVCMDDHRLFTMKSGAEFGTNKSVQGYYWDRTKTVIYSTDFYYKDHVKYIFGTVFTSPYNNAYNNDDVYFLITETTPVIEYNANGGTGKMPLHVWSWNNDATVAACDFIAPQGREFVTWCTNAAGSGTKMKPGDTIPTMTTGRRTLFAIWSSDKVSVGGGGGGGGGGSDVKKPDENVTAPLTVTCIANGKTIYEKATIEKIGSLMVVAPKLLGYEVVGGGSESIQIKDQNNYLTFQYEQFADVTLELNNHDKYVNGYPDGNFKPDDTITRAEAAAIFYRLVSNDDKADTGAARFNDVNDSDWYAPAVNYLAKNGIIQGYSDGNFRPSQTITRAEFAAIAIRFDKIIDSGMNAFSDVPYSHWSMEYINTAAEKGWVTGFPGGVFKPDDVVTRAQVVVVVNRMLDRKIDAADVPDSAAQYNDVPPTYWAYADVMEAATQHESDSRKANGSEIWK